jgi:hypothetical protein
MNCSGLNRVRHRFLQRECPGKRKDGKIEPQYAKKEQAEKEWTNKPGSTGVQRF